MKAMTTSKTKSLKDSELFRSLESKELGELENATRWEKLRRGRVLWLSDHAPASLVLVKTERIKLSRLSGNGRELVNATMSKLRERGALTLESRHLIISRSPGGTNPVNL